MPRYLALYTLRAEDLAGFRRRPKAEQDAIDAEGITRWAEWSQRHAAAIVDPGGMVGRTTRVTRTGLADAVNPVCGYLVVEAESPQAAAEIFRDHPHFSVFPGDGIDIMPLLT